MSKHNQKSRSSPNWIQRIVRVLSVIWLYTFIVLGMPFLMVAVWIFALGAGRDKVKKWCKDSAIPTFFF